MSTSAEHRSSGQPRPGPEREVLAHLRRDPEARPTVGLIGLFIADARAGGTSGGEGFVVGFLATLVVLVVATGLDGQRITDWSRLGLWHRALALVHQGVESISGHALRAAAVSIGLVVVGVALVALTRDGFPVAAIIPNLLTSVSEAVLSWLSP